jgi:hypothetical protein
MIPNGSLDSICLLSGRNFNLSRCSGCAYEFRAIVPNENSVQTTSEAIPRGEPQSPRPGLSLANEIRRGTGAHGSTVRTLISEPKGEKRRKRDQIVLF